MVQEPLIVTPAPDDPVEDLLDAADDRTVLIRRNGRHYRLDRLHEPASNEIERSIAGIRAAAGTWRDIDAEAFKSYVAERRRTSSRPPVGL